MQENYTGGCAKFKNKSSKTTNIDLNICKKSFHAKNNSFCRISASLAPVNDLEIFIEMIGIPNINEINNLKLGMFRSTGYKNASATFYKDYRIIVYDPKWAKENSAEAYLVFAHEAGHHFCKHVIQNNPLKLHELELEADRFAGFAIKNFELYHGKPFYNKVLVAAKKLFPVKASLSHPAKNERIRALNEGYEGGIVCGNLHRGIRGFSPKPR